VKTQTAFRAYERDQLLLLPPDMTQWLPQDHLVYFIRDVVHELDLSAIYAGYNGSKGGQPPYHPEMMVGLLVYAYPHGAGSAPSTSWVMGISIHSSTVYPKRFQ
jgi:transposase